DHGFHVAQRDSFFLADVENEFFKLIRNHHHVAAKRIDQFTGGIQIDLHVAGDAVFLDPADGIAFFHAAKFYNRTVSAESFANALVTLFVGQVHAAGVNRNADVVGDEDQHGIGVRISAVLLDGLKLVFVG